VRRVKNILVVQTAFLGDAILTLPLIQTVKDFFSDASIDVLIVPRTDNVFENHPAVRERILFDKKGTDQGWQGFCRIVRMVRARKYDIAFVPHRSIRSALLVFLAGIPIRIGFDRSAGRFLFTKVVKYRREAHEIIRNLSLLEGIGIREVSHSLPRLYPSHEDQRVIDRLLIELEVVSTNNLIALAPGTVWNTKRWLKERFASLAVNLDDEGFEVMLVGGVEDRQLCDEVHQLSGSSKVYNTAGRLSLLQSAELIRRCKILVSNDSAPMHLAVGVGTPVVALFGATVPEFGFAPIGPYDTVVETHGLRCRPCSSHGGEKCPIKTFDCMVKITHERVFARVLDVLQRAYIQPHTN